MGSAVCGTQEYVRRLMTLLQLVVLITHMRSLHPICLGLQSLSNAKFTQRGQGYSKEFLASVQRHGGRCQTHCDVTTRCLSRTGINASSSSGMRLTVVYISNVFLFLFFSLLFSQGSDLFIFCSCS